MPDHAGHYPQFYDDNGFDDTRGPDWNYVGSQYLAHPTGVYCHRTTPTGRRDCNGHRASDGLIGRAHDQGAEVYVSIGGWSKSEVFVGLSANAVSRRNFAKNCVGLIREYNFDGIDIDWEFPGYSPHGGTADDAKNFVLLLQDIRSALDAYTNVTYPNDERTFGLTAALPCHPSIIDIQDVPKISDILSEMNLLTFDFHGTWDDVVGINSPLYDPKSPEHSANGCVEHWVREGADKSKINLGVPFYGRSYGGATELGAPFDGADGMHWWADEGRPQYYNVLDQLPDMISIRDDATKTQVAYFEDGGILSFDDSQAVCDKVEYGRENELHGYMVWELAGDLTDDHKTPLLDVINYKLDQGDVFDCELWRLETRDEHGEVIGLKPREPNPWYVATWESGTCVNDGMQPEWEKEDNLFRRKEECCAHKFEYRMRDCIGPPTPPPTSTPTPEPTSSPVSSDEPTTGPSNVFGAALVIDPVASPSPVAREASQGPAPPETWCLGGCDGNEKCVGNQNHPQGVDDKTCRPCLSGQTYWPCDVDGLCFCWDETTPRIPPAPGSGLAQLSDERPCDYFTETIFNSLAPDSQHPYTYDGLCKAIDSYNEGHAEKIFMMGTEEERKSELAAFLGHTLHESDEWKASREYLMCADNKVVDGKTYCKPCDSGSFNWETFKCDGVGLVGDGLTFNGYCDFTIEPPQACPCDGALESETGDLEGYIPASKVFFGRGAIQLSWNYNFRAASEALTGDATTFCDDPDLVAITPEYAWGAGVFFWMENLKEETTCHIEALRSLDFGGTLNNINGGLECPAYHGGWHGEAIKLRLNRYCKSSAALGLESILIFDGCKGLNTSFVECLEDGTCPDCQQFSDGTEPIVIEGATTQQLDPIITADATIEESVEVIPVEPLDTPVDVTAESDSTPTATSDPPPAVEETVEVEEEVTSEVISEAELPQEEDQIVQLDESAASSSCPEDLKPVDGLPGCCVTEPAYHGDGACDPDSPFNTPECAFDGGDCCQETCDNAAHYGCSVVSSEFGPFGFFCIDPSMEDEYIDPESCTVSDRTRIGDGRCDAGVEMYNSEACNWDGGDCCVETCNQVYSHYDCGNYDCQNPDYATPGTQSPSKSPTSSPIKDSSSPTTSPIAPKSLAGSISSSFASGYASSASTETEPSLPTQSEPLSSTQTNVVTVIASDDATIEKSSPGSNHGSESILKVKGLPNGPNAHDAIMRFIIPAAQGISATTPIHALLKIYSLSDSNHGGILHTASETDWKEGDVTWDTAPEWDTRIDNVGAIEVDHWNIIDVSNVVSSLNGNEGTITIRIRSRDPAVIEYSSKEGDHPPQIIVSYGELTSFTTDASDPETEPDTVVTTPEPTQKPTPQPVEVTTTTSTTSTSQSSPEKVDAVHVLSPSDDATILSDHPYENYGSDSSLQVDNDSGVYDALIKFDLSGLDTSAVSSATLRLYCIDGSDAGGIFGKTITSNWDESSVTWDTAPAAYGSPLHSLGSVEKATWYEIDVTNLFSEGSLDTVSIRMTSSSWNRAGYSSKEGLHPPQLVIQGAEEASFIDSNVAEPTTDNVSVSQEQAAVVTGTGLFFPVWGTGGSISCIDGTSPPSWASGAYLKASKADCCNAFFSMQIDMCLKA